MSKDVMKKIKFMLPLEEIESEALGQAMLVAAQPETKRMVIMPDVHFGYSMPIGGVAVLDNHISPAYVGVDIGCGMIYLDTKVSAVDMFPDKDSKIRVFEEIHEKIPMGVGSMGESHELVPEFKSSIGDKDLDKRIAVKIFIQIGTLGGGNHFIEIGITESGTIAITIHSGSRGPGNMTAGVYTKKVGDHRMSVSLDSDLGQAYWTDMEYFIDYAFVNRLKMMEGVIKALGLSHKWGKLKKEIVNKPHNYAVKTEEGILHRKGATSSNKDELGIIPGNMRDGVWVVKGLGNDEWLNSSSHGAGRPFSRGDAKRNLSMDDFEEQMKDIVSTVSRKILDEAPDAYKDINAVLEPQFGVVIEKVDYVKPIINIKV